MDDIEIKTYDETYNLPIESYEVIDVEGKPVIVNPKNLEVHQSQHQFEQWAPVFYNIGWILQNPDKVRHSTSNNPRAIENRRKGDVKIFVKENFLSKLDLPGVLDSFRDEVQVVVLYEEETDKNYTLTYSIYPK